MKPRKYKVTINNSLDLRTIKTSPKFRRCFFVHQLFSLLFNKRFENFLYSKQGPQRIGASHMCVLGDLKNVLWLCILCTAIKTNMRTSKRCPHIESNQILFICLLALPIRTQNQGNVAKVPVKSKITQFLLKRKRTK